MTKNNHICILIGICLILITSLLKAEELEHSIKIKLLLKSGRNAKPYDKGGSLYVYKKSTANTPQVYGIPRDGITSILTKGNKKQTWIVEKKASLGSLYSGTVEIKAVDKTEQILLYVKKIKLSQIKGKVVDSRKKPFSNLLIGLWRKGENVSIATTRTDKAGFFFFKVLPNFDYKITLNSKYINENISIRIPGKDLEKKDLLIKVRRSPLNATLTITYGDNKVPFSLKYAKTIYPNLLFRTLHIYKYFQNNDRTKSSRYYKKLKFSIKGNKAFMYGMDEGKYQVAGVRVVYGKVLGKMDQVFYPVKDETIFSLTANAKQTLKIDVVIDKPVFFSLTGKVTDVDGTVIKKATINATLYPNFSKKVSTLTDVGGRFKVGLNKGQYRIECRKKGYKSKIQQIKLNSNNSISIKLTRQPVIKGVVLSPKGKYIEGVNIIFITKKHTETSSKTDKKGLFSIRKRDYKFFVISTKKYPAVFMRVDEIDLNKFIKVTLKTGININCKIINLPKSRVKCGLIFSEKGKFLHPLLGSRCLIGKNNQAKILLSEGEYDVRIMYEDKLYKLNAVKIENKTKNISVSFNKDKQILF